MNRCDYCDKEGEEWNFHHYWGGLTKCKDFVGCRKIHDAIYGGQE